MTKLFRYYIDVSKSIRIIERNRMCQSEENDKFILEFSCHILIMTANKNISKLATLFVKRNQNKL